MVQTLRECSKATHASDGSGSHEDIVDGSLQRIADALEKMAASYTDMEKSRDWWRERAEERNDRANRLERRLSATRGVVTKLKRQIAAMRARAVTP